MKTELTNLKHGDNVIINYGVIKNVSAVVNWVEYVKTGGDLIIQIWLKDIEPKIIQGHTKKFVQHIPTVVPLSWVN